MVKLAKVDKKQGKAKKAAPPPPPEDFEESGSEEESDEEELPAPPVKKASTPAAKTPQSANKKNGKAVKQESSEEEDDEEDEDEEEEDSEEESEEEKPTPNTPKPAVAVTKQAKEESDEDDDDDEDEEEDDEEADESEGEEAMDTAPPPKAKKAGMVKVQDEDEDEDEEEDEDEDDEESEDDEETEVVELKKAGKRKKEEQKAVTPAKKQKTENGASFSLYVGNLNSDKSFEELKKALSTFFSKKKLEVTDIRIGNNRKFGYVDFETEQQREKALEFNGNKLLGLAVKLDKARSNKERNLDKRDRDGRTLFVKNLPPKITQDTLREIFEDAIDIRIPTTRDGSGSRGIAYIEFENEAAADSALGQKQGTEIEGRAIMIDFTGNKSMLNVKAGYVKAGKQTQSGSDTLIVNNLAYSATEETLQNIFEKASLIKIPDWNGRPKGYAVIKFESIEDAKEALENHANAEIDGRTVRLEFASHRGFDGASKTLFVRGLSYETTEETLKDAFEGAASARVVSDRESGKSKGFGFVDFTSEEDAKLAKETMEDGEIDGCRVILDFARPKSENQRGGFGRGRGRGGFGGRGRGGRGGGRGGFGGFRGGKTTPQGKKIKFD